MSPEKARELQIAWGGRPCEHPSFAKERIMGSQTGDSICVQCGESFSPDEMAALNAARKAKQEKA